MSLLHHARKIINQAKEVRERQTADPLLLLLVGKITVTMFDLNAALQTEDPRRIIIDVGLLNVVIAFGM